MYLTRIIKFFYSLKIKFLFISFLNYRKGMDYENGSYDGYSGPPMKKVRGDEESGSGGHHHHGGSSGGHGMDRFLERQDEKIPPNHILLITVINNKYPINVEVIYKVTSIVGKIKRIVCFERNKVVQAMVEFETLESASKVRKIVKTS
jgi:hypothetical protein